MTTIGSTSVHNCICAPKNPEQTKQKDPLNLYFQHKFDENKAQQLAKLAQKHDAGEISDFQYNVEKYIIQHSEYQPIETVVHLNEVA